MFGDLPGAAVVARDLAAEDDIRVERIGDGVAVLLDADGMPFAEGDLAVVAAARHARRAALLLAAANASTGKALSALTWYICAVGWLYHELQVSPPLTVTIAP